MVTGQVPFAGKTPTETISLVLQKEPAPLTWYTHEVAAELDRIVTKALTKDREARYQTAKDLLIDLRNLKRKLEVDAEIDRTVPSELRATTTASGAAAAASPRIAHAASSAEYIVSGIKQHKFALALGLIVLTPGAVGFRMYLPARHTQLPTASM